MYTLVRSLPRQQLLLQQLPALIVTFIIAEMFYKFHSFTLECLAALATWFVLDMVISIASQWWHDFRSSPKPNSGSVSR